MNTSKSEAVSIGLRSTLIGVVANMLLAAVKAIAGIAGNSYALIADAIESTSDIASSFIVLGGIKIASLPADSDHPYGHGSGGYSHCGGNGSAAPGNATHMAVLEKLKFVKIRKRFVGKKT